MDTQPRKLRRHSRVVVVAAATLGCQRGGDPSPFEGTAATDADEAGDSDSDFDDHSGEGTSSATQGTSGDAGADSESGGGTAPVDLVCVDGATFRGGVVCSPEGRVCSAVLRIMSYNVHALPEEVSGDNPKDRMRRIGEILAEQRAAGAQPDFVLLQEAFDKEDRIIDRAGYLTVVEGPSQNFGLDSGLYIFSDHPVLATDRQSFDACAGTDCGAEKGVVAVHVEIAEMPHPLVVITTHLQAQSEHDSVRIEQINELVPYLELQNIGSKASVFAGDFNFKAKPDHESHPSYDHFVESTPYLSSGEACLENAAGCTVVLEDETKTDEDDVWLSTNDHQFHYASSSAPYGIEVLRAAVTFTEDFEGQPLSDHWAREFDYCLTWANGT